MKAKITGKLVFISLIVLVGLSAVIIQIRGNNTSISGNAIIMASEDKAAAEKLKVPESSLAVDKIKEKIGIGGGIANSSQPEDYFDTPLRDDDISLLQDTKVSFNGGGGYDNYRTHDEIWFGTDSPSIESALSGTSVDSDYKDGVGLKVLANSIYYYYVFDDAIDVSAASEEYPLEITFLGKSLKIVGAQNDRISVKVGETYFMNIGDTVTVNGHIVKLEEIGDDAVGVSVDGGELIVINKDGSHAWSEGVEVVVDSIFYKSGAPESSSANLIIGEDVTDTYKDGDEYIGETEGDERWRWEIDNLATSASTSVDSAGTASGPIIAIKNYFSADDPDDDDPAMVLNKGCYDMPTKDPYAQLCIDKLTSSSTMNLKIGFENANLDEAGGSYSTMTSVPVLSIESSKSDGLKLVSGSIAGGYPIGNIRTDKVLLMLNNTVGAPPAADPLVEVFYVDDNTNDITIAGNVTPAAISAGTGLIQINYEDTKGNDVVIGLQGVDNANRFSLNITANANEIPGTADVIGMYITNSSPTEFNGVNDMIYVSADMDTSISSQDEDLRTQYGIVIKDPSSHVSGDDPKFTIPEDAVRAVVTFGPHESSIDKIKERNKVVEMSSATNVAEGSFLVGGPAANKVTAEAMSVDFPTNGNDLGWKDGWCFIKDTVLNGKTVTIIAGWDKQDTSDCVDMYLDGVRDHDGIMSS